MKTDVCLSDPAVYNETRIKHSKSIWGTHKKKRGLCYSVMQRPLFFLCVIVYLQYYSARRVKRVNARTVQFLSASLIKEATVLLPSMI